MRVQPLSGSHSPPSPRMAGGPRPCGSATLVQALAGALCTSVLAVTGITNKSLRALMTGCSAAPTTPPTRPATTWPGYGQRLITRIPAEIATASPEGLAFAIFYTKLHDRLLRPCSPPTAHQHHHHCERHCTPSIFTSQKPSTRRACCRKQPETQTLSPLGVQSSLRRLTVANLSASRLCSAALTHSLHGTEESHGRAVITMGACARAGGQ